jgi:hypothetical protein
MAGSEFEYQPRKPEETILYRTVASEMETFLARRQERERPVPKFVEREFRRYLTCGIAEHVAERVEKRWLAWEQENAPDDDGSHAGLAALYASAVQGRVADGPNRGNRVTLRTGDRIDGDGLEAVSSPRGASLAGFSLHANVAISAYDRARLERLVRYAARPALSEDRLSQLADGRLAYRLKRQWSNGATEVIFERQDFMAKLAALVPVPRVHLVRFHGIIGPAAKLRSTIVPKARESEPVTMENLCLMEAPKPEDEGVPSPVAETAAIRPNYTWASLMMRVQDRRPRM